MKSRVIILVGIIFFISNLVLAADPGPPKEKEWKGKNRKMADQTKKVNLELEIDTSLVDSSKNRYQGLIDLAVAVDQWRIFPRVFISTYIYLLYKVTIWFMGVEDPTIAQSGLVSIVVGAGAAWFGLYAGTSKSKK